MPWPGHWERQAVLAALEMASGQSLSVSKTLPDSLITRAQELNLGPVELNIWILAQAFADEFTHAAEPDFSPDALAHWAYKLGLAAEIEP